MAQEKKIRPYADLDEVRFMVVRALEHYQKELNSLVKSEEIVQPENDKFENYLVKAAKQAHIAAEELRQDPNSDITTVVKEEEYRSIVKEALTYYLAALEKSTKIVQEKLGAGSSSSKPILAHYNNEIRLANNLKQSVSEATP